MRKPNLNTIIGLLGQLPAGAARERGPQGAVSNQASQYGRMLGYAICAPVEAVR